jgi:uncharacterized protein YukE
MSRPADLSAALQRLKRATRELQDSWSETRQEWNDQASRDFEDQYLEPIMPQLRLLLAASTEFEETLRLVRRELE